MKPLTRSQQPVLESIRVLAKTDGVEPSLRQVAAFTGLSLATVKVHCENLADAGYLIHRPNRVPAYLLPKAVPA